jgi:hypothetical protein
MLHELMMVLLRVGFNNHTKCMSRFFPLLYITRQARCYFPKTIVNAYFFPFVNYYRSINCTQYMPDDHHVMCHSPYMKREWHHAESTTVLFHIYILYIAACKIPVDLNAW